jgi:hypothetical protein
LTPPGHHSLPQLFFQPVSLRPGELFLLQLQIFKKILRF